MLAIGSGLASDQTLERRSEVPVHGGGVRRRDLEVVHQSSSTLPRVCLTALRCFFLSTRSAFAARLGRVGLRLRGAIWAAAIISASRAARVAAVRILRAEAPRGDEQLAGAGDPASGDALQPLVDIGVQAEPEQVDAQLDRGCDLVDVLPAWTRRSEEVFAERVLGNDDVLRPHRPIRRNSRAAAR